MPTDGVDFDTGEISDSGTTSDSPMHGTAASTAASGTAAYVPPPASAQPSPVIPQPSGAPDVEQGTTTTTAVPETTTPSTTIPEPAQSQPSSQEPPKVDLLDDAETGQAAAPVEKFTDEPMQTSLHELD